MKVLYLTPWYPSERDAMSGLFVQKHADAVRAQGVDVRVIHAFSWRELWREWCAFRREGWMPDVVQLNVIQKLGLPALWLKKRYGIPYVVIEHWTGYLPESGRFEQMPKFKRNLYKRLAREAEVVMTVSEQLKNAMQALGFQAKRWELIDNVVDDFFYKIPNNQNIQSNPNLQKTLLNVTCYDEPHKNVKGLLRAAKMLSSKRLDWRLVMVGSGVDYQEVRAYADSLELPEGLIEWTGELTPREVADRMHRADALVLSSRYETYSVVLAEAAAAGLPILSTPVGIAEELPALIVPQEIAQNKPGRFAEFIETILWGTAPATKTIDRNRFNAETIGNKLKSIYQQALSSQQA